MESDSEPLIKDAQVAVFVAHNSRRHRCLHFLRDYADISAIIANVTKAIVSEAISKMAEKDNVTL